MPQAEQSKDKKEASAAAEAQAADNGGDTQSEAEQFVKETIKSNPGIVREAIENDPEIDESKVVVLDEKGEPTGAGSSEYKDRFLQEIKQAVGPEHAERAEDSLRQSEIAFEAMTTDQQKKVMELNRKGQTPARSPKQVRDQAGTNWMFGAHRKKLQRQMPGYQARKNLTPEFLLSAIYTYQKAGSIHGDFYSVVAKNAKNFGFHKVADMIEKDLVAGDADAGGNLIPTALSPDIIEFAYANDVFSEMNTIRVPLPNGGLDVAGLAATATANFVGERSEVNASSATFDKSRLEEHELQIVSIVSNKLLRNAVAGIEDILRNDMLRVATLERDLQFIEGTGGSGNPTGLDAQIDSATTVSTRDVQSGTDPSATEIYQTVGYVLQQLAAQNHFPEEGEGHWIMHPNEKLGAQYQVDNGEQIEAMTMELANGTLAGHPISTSTQISNGRDDSGDGDNDESRIYFGNPQEIMVGVGQEMEIETSNEATVPNASGTDENMFTTRSTALSLTGATDMLLRRPQSWVNLQAVTWGADTFNL